MFDLFKNHKALVEKLTNLASKDDVLVLAKSLNSYTEQLAKAVEANQKISLTNSAWAQEFHRLLLNEYAQHNSSTVYGIIYLNMQNRNTRRLMMVAADKFEKAVAIGEAVLTREGEEPKAWQIENFQSIDLPRTTEDVVGKVDSMIPPPQQKPLGVFVNDLRLVSDKWADKKERAVLSKLIKKIEEVYTTDGEH